MIREGDRLLLAGDISRVKELASSRGLKIMSQVATLPSLFSLIIFIALQDDQIIHPSINRVLAEAVLAPRYHQYYIS